MSGHNIRRIILPLLLAIALQPHAPAMAQAFAPAAGTEARQWLPDRATAVNTPTRVPVNITDDVTLTMRDGTRLDARLFTPVLAANAAPTPCVLMTDGYGRASNTGAGVESTLFDIAARGYAVLHLSLRGSGKSGGTNDLYNEYGHDGYDAIEWMAKQTWCNGRVGMVGPSLLGISQWLAAKEAPPSLKVIVPEVACGDCYGVLWYPGGMLPGPGREARKLSPGAEAEYPTARQHREFDSWWRARTTLPEDHASIAGRGVAAFIAGGLDDYISPANIRAYEEFQSAGGARKRLFLGPYAHGWHTEYIAELQIQWLDHWLKDVANGADTAPRVIVYIKGANRWRYEADWPIADATPVSLALQPARSGSIDSRNDGTLGGAPAAGPPATVAYAPQTGPFLPVLLSATVGRSQDDQRPFEQKVATWTTNPLAVATEVTGYPKISIWAASSATDADLVFSLNDVAPDGRSTQVIQAYMNAPHATARTTPVALVPGTPRLFTLEMFPTAYVFQKGHRLRLAVAGGASAAAGLPYPQGPGPNPMPSTWTILQDAEHPSTIELPVIGTGGASLAH